MKGVTQALKIIAIILNGIFLAGLIFFLIKFSADPRTVLDWAGFISMFAFAPMTIVAIALTFGKKLQVLRLVLRIIAIIVNASFLLILIYSTAIGQVHLEGPAMWIFGLMGYGLPVVNVLALALTFRKEKEASVG
jgi:hypothetical protein